MFNPHVHQIILTAISFSLFTDAGDTALGSVSDESNKQEVRDKWESSGVLHSTAAVSVVLFSE